MPPRRLLTALDAEDERPQARRRPTPGVLPADLMDLMGRPGLHWAGNLNIFVGGRAVERHLAQALRVYPGRLNVAMFVVGSGRDAYRFHVVGEGTDWKARLHDMTDGKTLTLDVRGETAVAEGRWIKTPGQRLMMLSLEPPADCGAGAVAVHVTQRLDRPGGRRRVQPRPEGGGAGVFRRLKNRPGGGRPTARRPAAPARYGAGASPG